MTDVFSVTATWDKASYTTGQTITGTISGGDVSTTTTTTTTTVGPVTIPVVAADGAKSSVSIPAVPVTTTTTVAHPRICRYRHLRPDCGQRPHPAYLDRLGQ